MTTPRPLKFRERLFVSATARFSRVSRGFWIAFGDELVREYGVSGFLVWAQTMEQALRRMQKQFGEQRTHLLSAFSSIWNGCDYCGYGNILAHNLYHFKETGKLFPISEHDTFELMRMRDTEVISRLETLLGKDYRDDLALIRRQLEIKQGAAVAGSDADRALRLSCHLYDFINECSIVVDEEAPALTPLIKDTALVNAYHAAQKEAGVKRHFPNGTST